MFLEKSCTPGRAGLSDRYVAKGYESRIHKKRYCSPFYIYKMKYRKDDDFVGLIEAVDYLFFYGFLHGDKICTENPKILG